MKKHTLTLAVAAFAGLSFCTTTQAADKVLVSKSELNKLIDEGVQQALGKLGVTHPKAGKLGEKAVSKGLAKLRKSQKERIEATRDDLRGGDAATLKRLDADWTTIDFDSQRDAAIDHPVVAQPAVVAIGLAGAAPEVNNARKFASALVSGSDEKGKLKTGVAASLNLGKAWDSIIRPNGSKDTNLDPSATPLAAYEENAPVGESVENWFERQLYRSNLSAAFVKGTGDKDDKSVQIGIGVSTILYDHYDPFMRGTEMDRVRDELKLSRNASKETVAAALNQSRWLRSGAQVGFVPTFLSADGNAKNMDTNGYTGFLTSTWVYSSFLAAKSVDEALKNGFKRDENLFGFTVHARWRADEGYLISRKVKTAKGVVDKIFNETQDSLLVAGRVTYGSRNDNVAIEGGYMMLEGGPTGDHNAFRVSGAYSHRVTDNVYFVISGGQTYGAEDELFAIGSFRFGASESASLMAGKGE